ncbi:hypothetical protein DFH06DRAFT_606247 [Mycena polygramma]|nr:hypothetical protein DFH06DRAFT_606247 [Mycena polygramma]
MEHYRDLWERNKATYYGRVVAMIASSGTGKTKLNLEYLRKHGGLYICLRSASDSPGQGWPPGDVHLTSYLELHRDKPLALVTAALIGAVLETVEQQFTSLDDHNKSWKLRAGSRLTRSDPRLDNMAKVASKAKELLYQHLAEFISKMCSGAQSVKEDAELAVELICEGPADKLARKVPHFLLVVDECTVPSFLFPSDQISPLLRVMECLSKHNLWFVLVSTSAKIVSIVPSMNVRGSQRFINQTSLPPWFYLPFDPYLAGRPITPTISAALKLQEIKQYGRPLWRIYTDGEVLPAAQMKLLGASGLMDFDESQIFSLYSQRICLHLNPSASSHKLEVMAVESHLRQATGIHGGMLLTTCPSEPILALAAATAINSSPECARNTTQALVALITKYQVDRGLEGELYARLIMVMARDAATPTLVESEALQPTSLAAFLRSLLHRQHIPATSLATFERIGVNVQLTFTHFVELEADIGIIDADWCFDMLCRGAAAQCTFCQPVIDGLIVGYSGDLSQAFDETQLFLVCYQVKARHQAASAALGTSLTCPMVRYRNRTLVKPKHLLLLIDMATTTKFQAGSNHIQITERPAIVPVGQASGKDWAGYAAAHNQLETRGHLIDVRGLDPYAVLAGVDLKGLYSSISPEGPMAALFRASARSSYLGLVTAIPRS